MKAWAEGFRVHSRGTAEGELRPPKTSLAKASGEDPIARRRAACGWIALAVVTPLALFVLVAALS